MMYETKKEKRKTRTPALGSVKSVLLLLRPSRQNTHTDTLELSVYSHILAYYVERERELLMKEDSCMEHKHNRVTALDARCVVSHLNLKTRKKNT